MCIKIKLTTQQTVLLMAVISPFSCKSVILTYCFEKIAKPLLKPLTHPSQTPQKDLTNPSQTPHKPLTKTSQKLHKAIDQIIVAVSKLPFFSMVVPIPHYRPTVIPPLSPKYVFYKLMSLLYN